MRVCLKWRFPLIIFLLFLFAVFFFSGCGASTAEDPQPLSMTIIHVNDTHSRLEDVRVSTELDLGNGKEIYYMYMGSYPRLAAKVNKIRSIQSNTLFLHAGDLVQGSLYFTLYNGQAGIDFMNMMKLDAMVTGNHEFDRGPELLGNLIDQAEFPILAANIDTSGDPYLANKILPYVIKDVGGQKVGIIGLVTKSTTNISQPGPNITFLDEHSVATQMVTQLEALGINKIIVLSHIGYDQDIELAQAIPGIDVIVGGHSHTLLGDFSTLGLNSDGPYPTEVKSFSVINQAGEKVCVVQDWRWSILVGELLVDFDENGKITSCEGCPVLMVGSTFLDKDRKEVDATTRNHILRFINSNPKIEYVPEESQAKAKLEQYKQGVEEFGKEVVARVADDLWHVRIPGQTHPEGGVLVNGSYIAPHVSNSMLWKINQTGLNAHMAVINAGGVRKDIVSGDLTVGDIYKLLPFGNSLVVVDLTGREIMNSLDNWVGDVGGGPFPYLAGGRYNANMNLEEGQRITSFEIKTKDGVWETVNLDALYRVVTISFIRFDKANPDYYYDTGFLDAEVFLDYARSHSPLDRIPTNVSYTPAL